MQDRNLNQFAIDEWIINGDVLLGIGTYGKILQCYHRDQPDILLSVKMIPKQNFQIRDGDMKKTIENEKMVVEKLAHVQCCNLVKIIKVIDEPTTVYIIMELCDRDLQKEFESMKDNWFSQSEQIDIIQQIILGACCLKENQLIHRDIKPQNILVKDVIDSNGKLRKIYKVADFGLSRTLQNMYQNANLTFVGTWKYLAPEIYYQQQFSAMCDIYSYGLLFYQIAFKGELPYNEENQRQYYEKIKISDFKCQEILGQYGHVITNLINKMIVFTAENRINFEQLKEHEICKIKIKNQYESLFIKFNQEQRQNQIQIQQNRNLNSKFERIYKLLSIYYHKYLLCDQVRKHIRSQFQQKNQFIMLTIIIIGRIGLQQLKYALSLIKIIYTEIEDTLIQGNDLPFLLEILKKYQEQSQITQIYGQLNQNIISTYHQLKEILNKEYCEYFINKVLQENNTMLKKQNNLLHKLFLQKFECGQLCNQLKEFIEIQKNIYNQADLELINRIINIQKDFDIKNYYSIDVNKIFQTNKA